MAVVVGPRARWICGAASPSSSAMRPAGSGDEQGHLLDVVVGVRHVGHAPSALHMAPVWIAIASLPAIPVLLVGWDSAEG